MPDIIELKWSFTPKDYFEDELKVVHNEYVLFINEGVAIAQIKPEFYDEEHQMRTYIHDLLNQMFLGAQLLERKPFKLSKSTMSRIYPDGRRDATVFPNSIAFTLSSPNVDLIVKDEWGNIVADSKRDRIEQKKRLAILAAKHSTNLVLISLLDSYQKSVNDPENELIYLYEIRDALREYFKNEREAQKELNISANKWGRLRRLANDKTIRQGRHRGQSLTNLRDATPSELKEARNIALRLIESYIEYLDK